MKSKGGAVSYSEQLQAVLLCPVPACISFRTDDAVGVGMVKNAADEYISDALL